MDNRPPLNERGIPVLDGYRMPTDHPGMGVFAGYKAIAAPMAYQYLGFAPSIILAVLAAKCLHIIYPGIHWSVTLVVVLIAIIVGFGIGVAFVIRLSLILMKGQAKGDAVRFHAAPDEIHVGISYSDRTCFFRGESSWDRGYIRIDESSISFRGFGPPFTLPWKDVQRSYLQLTSSGVNHLPRIFVEWIHPQSGSNYLSFEIRDAADREKCFDRSIDLHNRIVHKIANPGSADVAPVFPFESSSLDLTSLQVIPSTYLNRQP